MSVKSFLVIASMALSVLIGVVLGRQGPSVDVGAADGRPIRIGLSLDTLKEARWTRDRDAFVARANELGAVVTVLSANGDDNRLSQHCQGGLHGRGFGRMVGVEDTPRLGLGLAYPFSQLRFRDAARGKGLNQRN